MTSALKINGKSLYPIKEAVQETSYSRDYVTRLAREGKIVATTVSRQWFVDIDSLKTYAESATLEQEIRKKQLSAERKQERQIRKAADRQKQIQEKQAESLHVRSVVTAVLVLGFGLVSGIATHSLILSPAPAEYQMASTQEARTVQVSKPNHDAVLATETAHARDSVSSVGQSNLRKSSASNANPEIKSLGDVNEGILLLPSATTTVAAMFSDHVVVGELIDGTEVVVRVDSSGKAIGNVVPFVTVPVEQRDI